MYNLLAGLELQSGIADRLLSLAAMQVVPAADLGIHHPVVDYLLLLSGLQRVPARPVLLADFLPLQHDPSGHRTDRREVFELLLLQTRGSGGGDINSATGDDRLTYLAARYHHRRCHECEWKQRDKLLIAQATRSQYNQPLGKVRKRFTAMLLGLGVGGGLSYKEKLGLFSLEVNLFINLIEVDKIMRGI
eukprot:g44902.t1